MSPEILKAIDDLEGSIEEQCLADEGDDIEEIETAESRRDACRNILIQAIEKEIGRVSIR